MATHRRHGRFTDFTHTKWSIGYNIIQNVAYLELSDIMEYIWEVKSWWMLDSTTIVHVSNLKETRTCMFPVCRECENISHEDHLKTTIQEVIQNNNWVTFHICWKDLPNHVNACAKTSGQHRDGYCHVYHRSEAFSHWNNWKQKKINVSQWPYAEGI